MRVHATFRPKSITLSWRSVRDIDGDYENGVLWVDTPNGKRGIVLTSASGISVELEPLPEVKVEPKPAKASK